MKLINVVIDNIPEIKVLNRGIPIGVGKDGAVYLVEINNKKCALKVAHNKTDDAINALECEAKNWNDVMSNLAKTDERYKPFACASSQSGIIHQIEETEHDLENDSQLFNEQESKNSSRLYASVLHEDIESKEKEVAMLLLPFIRQKNKPTPDEISTINTMMNNAGFRQKDNHAGNYMVTSVAGEALLIPIDLKLVEETATEEKLDVIESTKNIMPNLMENTPTTSFLKKEILLSDKIKSTLVPHQEHKSSQNRPSLSFRGKDQKEVLKNAHEMYQKKLLEFSNTVRGKQITQVYKAKINERGRDSQAESSNPYIRFK